MLMYLLVFVASFVVDIIPFIGPPAWTVMVFFQLKYHLNIWAMLAAGVLGSTIGRYLLTLYIRRFTSKVVKVEKDKALAFLGKKLSGKMWQVHVVVFVYTLIPVPTTPLFTALGMAKVKALKVMPTFFVGKFISDMYMVYAGKFAAENTDKLIHGLLSWKTISGAVAGVLLLLFFLFVDWRMLLEKKKFRLHFSIWK